MKLLLALALSTIAAISFAQEDSTKKEPSAKPKKTEIEWKEIDAAKFADKLTKAAAAGEKWTKNPESIILEYAGPFITESGEKIASNRNIRIYTKGEEVPKFLSVVLIDDGLFDDSIKTQRTRLALARNEDGTWKLHKAYQANVKWPKIGE